MKNLIVLVLFFSFIRICYSQAMVFPGSEWHHSVSEFWNQNVGYAHTVYDHDTLIDQNLFHILISKSYQPNGLIYPMDTMYFRSDSDRVYSWFPEDTIRVLYDFSAQPGDTSFMYYRNWSIFDSLRVIVDSVDVVYINSIPLRRIWYDFHPGERGMRNPVCERLGGAGFLMPISITTDGPYYYLNCYSDSLWSYQQFVNRPCDYLYVSSDSDKSTDKLSVIPLDESVGKYELRSESGISPGQFFLYTSDGRKISDIFIRENIQSFSFSLPQPGVYFWQYNSGATNPVLGRIIYH